MHSVIRNPHDPSKVGVINNLPAAHRDHLFEMYAAQIPEGRRLAPKVDALAKAMTDRAIAPYRQMYLHKKGPISLFVFRENEEVEETGDDQDEEDAEPIVIPTITIVKSLLRRHYPGVERGIRPRLHIDGTPSLYRMTERDGALILEFAALAPEQVYYESFDLKTYRHDQYYLITLHDDPFTIEMRSSLGFVKRLYRTVYGIIGLDLNTDTRCSLADDEIRDDLHEAIGTTCWQANQTRDHEVFSRSTYESQPGVDLEGGGHLDDIESEDGVAAFSRKYEWTFTHPDGYKEACMHSVNLVSGVLRIQSDMSEPAIAKLRSEIVSLF